MSGWLDYLIMAPVVLPLMASALMLLFDGRSRAAKATVNVIATIGFVATAFILLGMSGEAPTVALIGNWPAPFGIVLVADRLSAFMLALTSVLALASLIYALARWHRAGAHFHPLFQLLLMGLSGAFLTGDLFNLFVFFEVLLAASYGLVLHGSGGPRVRAGLHYIAINLAASFLFLIGVALIYGATGTLNMADLALIIPEIADEDRALMEAGAAILAVAFLTKAAIWPLCFWLPITYTVASPPVAAMMAIMSKVGIYIILRLSLMLFGDAAGDSAGFGREALLYGGLATLAFGTFGVLASQDTPRLAAFSLLISSGTLLGAIGLGLVDVTGGALFYLASSTLAICAFFLLIELVERGRDESSDMLAVTMEAFGEFEEEDPEDQPESTTAIPATMAILSVSFLCCALLLAGLPPLSGFIAKFAILSPLLNADGGVALTGWLYLALVIISGMTTIIAAARAGIRSFWAPIERDVPLVRFVEIGPVAMLLALCFALTLRAGPVMDYLDETAQALHAPTDYIEHVLTRPVVGGEAQANVSGSALP